MRPPTSTLELLDLVRKSGIHPSSHLDDRLRTFPNLPVDPTQTATMLVKQGMLTKFQARLLLTGRYRGFKLGSYVVSEQIGQGGMGAVYLAEHETLKRRVALKVLPPSKTDPNAKLNIERFLREARSVAALDHPNIVRIHDVGHHGDVHFLVMEYVEGQSLEDLLKKGGPITPSRAVEYIAQAAAGLQHAHEKGFIHRDIKPANLMLAKDGTVKILDMGLARSCTKESDKLTERLDEGAIVGTADFISPEQAMNLPGIDIRTDIYSLGATFFALVTGTPPFAGNTTQKLVQHQMKDAPSLTTIDRTFPPELAKVVTKMLHKKPEKRYQSPGEVITAVAEWLPNAGAQRMVVSLSGTDLAHSAEMQATLSEIATGGTQRISKSRRMAALRGDVPWKLYGTVGTAVAAAVVLVCWMVFGGSSTKDQPGANNTTVAPIPSPNANPNPTPPVKVNAVVPAAASQVVHRFDPADLQPFRVQIQSGSVRDGEKGPLPAGWECQVYDKVATGEFRVLDVEGSKVFAVGCTEGKSSSQLVYRPDRIGQKVFTAGRTYEVRGEYKCDPEVGGYISAQTVGEWKSLNTAKLNSESWQWATNRFTVPIGAEVQIAVGSNTTAPGKFVYVRRIEIVETNDPPPVASVKVLFKLDLSKQQQFLEGGKLVMGVNGQRDWKIAEKTGSGNWPLGWYGRPWRELDEAEFFAETLDAQPALGSRNTKGLGSAMIYTPEINGLGGYCRMELEYRTDSKIKQSAHLRFLPSLPMKGKAFDLKKLDSTNGSWKTISVDLELQGSTAGRVEFHNAETGPGGELRIRNFTLTAVVPEFRAVKPGSPPPTAPPVAAKPVVEDALVKTIEFGSMKPFRCTFMDKMTDTNLAAVLPQGVNLNCWNSASVAEFRADEVNGKTGIGITNLNDTNSGQLHLHDLSGLVPGQTYRLRIEYLTKNDATGKVSVRKSKENFTSIATAELPGTNGQWKTKTLDFTRPPAGVETDAQIGNPTVGEGNTLYVHKIEIVALKDATK